MEPIHPDQQAEQARLAEVLSFLNGEHARFAAQKEDIDARVAYSLKHYNSDNAEQFTELTYNLYHQEQYNKKFSETRYALKKPYFARVDFNPDDGFAGGRHYIGKMTLLRELEILITDWRAPVASLYYEGRIGRAAYDSPDGEIPGEITLKRQYSIENGQLNGITDIDITTNDEFLQAALGSSKDRRLKDIVTTIQAEQNRVIRSPLFTPLIVQGAAGGGKTTIALHRIAYLLYAYEKQLLPRQVMIMAPSRFFLSYISDVLPDLGVERVAQTTFEDFAAECIELNTKVWSIIPASSVVAEAVERNETPPTDAMRAARLKSGPRFMKLIARYIKYITETQKPGTDFVLEGYELFTHEALADLFLREYDYLPVAKRVNELHKHLLNTLRKERPLILAAIGAEYDKRREAVKRKMEDGTKRRALITALLNERDEKLKKIRNKSKTIIRQYLKAYKTAPALDYYQMLFNKPGLFEALAKGLFKPEETDIIKSRAALSLAARSLETEDLPPLLIMQLKLHGMDAADDIKHIVIDEAQDFSLFQFAALGQIARGASFSILGDLHQGIYSYRAIHSWEGMSKRVFPQNSAFMTLEQSYRTTVEIMDAANAVIVRLYDGGAEIKTPLAKPVIRRGERVKLRVVGDMRELAAEINKKIAAYTDEGRQSIAVICKTLGECESLRKLLKPKPALITGKEPDYAGGLLILPAYLSKGLEFDAVILANVSERQYTQRELDIKLLYIAMTRALHSLAVFSAGEPSALVRHLEGNDD